ncbi:hypothetical protein VPNG_07297 [Cytospora leucostoma]|uniref:LTD domain-containing protein n=1 Tax=Cytospora leucostoma TaxID=1230097 RepID=A0A423WKD1_9PEZI|nr:hypothetical protein VPNG_07297 [Cytospora leucostoma]
MGISNYGLWKGTPLRWNGTAARNHGHLTFTDSTDTSKTYEADVNIESSGKEKRLVYWLISSYDAQKPSTSQLQAQPQGFARQSGSDSLALDFLREKLVNVDSGVLLSHSNSDPEEKGDILSYLDPILDEAVSSKATIYLWGSQYNDSDGTSGIHDIHMNQGSTGSFERENGTYQDGGIVIEFSDRWEAVFLAFASQAVETDSKGDADGPTFAATLGGESTGATDRASQAAAGVVIEAAIVNPVGPDDAPTGAQGETVYLLNRSPEAQSVEGWTLGNEKGGSQKLKGKISANAKRAVAVTGFRLSNRGGKIVVKNAQGETVSEVSYDEKKARKQGKLLYFAN